ncbi:MAG: putative glycolipid-binding domain-containing protein [Thermoanaerobaculia bacterium]
MHVVETIVWKSIPWPGHESARLLSLDGAWQLEGTAAFLNDGQPCRLAYAITCDENWHTRRATVNGWIGDRTIEVIIEAANGVWTMNGVTQQQVAGCIDIDLNFSPSTNLLPIRRQATDVRAAWLRFPSFALEPLEQRYTRLADDRVRYESFTTNFSAELRISPNGMVVDYENIWMAER